MPMGAVTCFLERWATKKSFQLKVASGPPRRRIWMVAVSQSAENLRAAHSAQGLWTIWQRRPLTAWREGSPLEPYFSHAPHPRADTQDPYFSHAPDVTAFASARACARHRTQGGRGPSSASGREI